MGFHGPPRGQNCGRVHSLFPYIRFTFPGAHGDSSGGLLGNLSNLPAPSFEYIETGIPGELFPGYRDQAYSQRAAGVFVAVISFLSTLSSENT